LDSFGVAIDDGKGKKEKEGQTDSAEGHPGGWGNGLEKKGKKGAVSYRRGKKNARLPAAWGKAKKSSLLKRGKNLPPRGRKKKRETAPGRRELAAWGGCRFQGRTFNSTWGKTEERRDWLRCYRFWT